MISSTGRAPSVLSLSSNRDGGRPWHLDDVDEDPSWDEHNNKTFNGTLSPRAISPTPRNRSYLTGAFSARHRNGSAVSIRRELYTPDNEYAPPLGGSQTSPQPIAIGAGNRREDSYDEDYDEYAERTFVDRRDMTLFPDHIREEDEQRHLRNLNEQEGPAHATSGLRDDYSGGSNQHPDDFWTEQDLNTLQEGDRIGIGLTHEGYPVIDALIDSVGSSTASSPGSPFHAPDDGIQFEVVRQLGYGSYAIVYLVKEILYEPDHGNGDHDLFPHVEEEDGAMVHEKTVYGREFALKCLSKRNLTDDQITVQKFEATLHRTLPEHPNVVALHRVSHHSRVEDCHPISRPQLTSHVFPFRRLWKLQLGFS